MKFIVDAQLPLRLKKWLVEKGHDVKHTRDLPHGNLIHDNYIIQIADEEERIIITKDKDFHQQHLLNNFPKRLLCVVSITNIQGFLFNLFDFFTFLYVFSTSTIALVQASSSVE